MHARLFNLFVSQPVTAGARPAHACILYLIGRNSNRCPVFLRRVLMPWLLCACDATQMALLVMRSSFSCSTRMYWQASPTRWAAAIAKRQAAQLWTPPMWVHTPTGHIRRGNRTRGRAACQQRVCSSLTRETKRWFATRRKVIFWPHAARLSLRPFRPRCRSRPSSCSVMKVALPK